MGSKGGGTTVMLPQMQAQTTTVAPNPVALAGYANVVGQAQDLQAQHQGFTPDQQQAFNQVQQLQGVANPWINSAGDFAGQGLAAGNQLIQQGANAGSPQNFGQNINAYMSPYMDDVVKATMANINETNAQQQSQLTGNAIAQGALGGNRVGVAGSELARQQNLTNNATLAQILQQGYGQAGQNLFQNAGLQMQAGNSLGSLGNQTAGIYSGLGNEALSTGLQGANALLQTGGMQQALPYQQLGWLSGIVNNTGPNMGQTGTQNSMGFTSQYQPQPNMFNSLLGAGVAGAGMLMSSDKRVKEDAHEVGKLHDGQKIYRFRYKGEPGYHVGLMAQEVEKRHPEAVGEVNGVKGVDYREATKDAVRKAHGGGLGEYDSSADDYDAPMGGGFGAIPQVKPTNTRGLQLPQFLAMQQAHQGQQQQDRSPSFADFGKAGKGLRGLYDSYGTGGEDFSGGADDVAGDMVSEARGGRVRGYDDGGEVIDDTATSPDPFSDEGGVRAPRSVRNNNPGNIEDGPFARGLPGYKGGDGRFAVFDSPDSGVGAQDRLLESYGKRGFNTPAAIVGRWAPAAENGGDSTNRYVSHVSQKLGVDPNTPLDMSDPNVRVGVRSAMAEYEAGTNGQTGALAYANPGDGGGGLGAINSAAPIAEGRSADTGVAPPDAEPGFLESLGVPKISPDTRAALISAGLGMMASKSHWLGPAIGEGGLQGIKTYYQNQQNTRQNANTQSEIANRAGLLGVAQQRNTIGAYEAQTRAANVASEAQYRKDQTDIAKAGLLVRQVIPNYGFVVFDPLQNRTYTVPFSGIKQAISQPPAGGVAPPTIGQPPAAVGAPQNLNSAVTTAGQPSATAPSPNAASGSPAAVSSTEPERGAASMMNWKPATSVDDIPPNQDGTPYMPKRQVNISMDEGQKKVQLHQLDEQLKPINDAVRKTEPALMRLTEMDHAIDNLPKTGLLAPGTGAEYRMKLGIAGNTMANALGIKPFFNDSSLASLQQLHKDTVRLGQEMLSSTFGGGREAGFIIQQSIGANPGASNTLSGYKRISAGLRESQRYIQDYATFMNDYGATFSNLTEANERFRQLNPASKYVDRAILATVNPSHAQKLIQNQNDPEAIKQFGAKYGNDAAQAVLRYQ